MNFFRFTTFARVKIFCWILNLNYQSFLYEFRSSHDSLCLKMGDSQFLGNLFTKLYDFIPPKPVMYYIQVFLSSIYVAYFHVTIGYNLRASRIPILFVPSHTVCSAETRTVTACLHFKSVDKAEGTTASTNSCNSKPSLPSICKFQAVYKCVGSVTSCLFICGLLNGALDSLECLKLIALIGNGKL